jgi:hypothetical protein
MFNRMAGAHCPRPAVVGTGNVPAIRGSALLRDDNGNGGGRPKAPRNVLGGGVRSNKHHRAALLAISINLDIQAIRERPLCGGSDSLLIRMRERSVTDIRRTAACREAAKLIEPRCRCRFELPASNNRRRTRSNPLILRPS